MKTPKSINLGKTIAGGVALGTLALPLLKGTKPGSTIVGELKAGRYGGAAEVFLRDGRAAVSLGNVVKAATPVLAFGVVRYGAKALGVPAPKLGPVRAW